MVGLANGVALSTTVSVSFVGLDPVARPVADAVAFAVVDAVALAVVDAVAFAVVDVTLAVRTVRFVAASDGTPELTAKAVIASAEPDAATTFHPCLMASHHDPVSSRCHHQSR